jgi:hypothetical protein
MLSTYFLTYSVEQSPSLEANRFSASQEIRRILWKPKVHYRIHKCHHLSFYPKFQSGSEAFCMSVS